MMTREAPSLSNLTRHLADGRVAPPASWNPPFCGDIDMRIAVDGTWYYQGSPIGRAALVRLFASVLRREADGRYVLVTPVEKLGIRVDDAPFVAVAVLCEGQGEARRMAFRLNTEAFVWVDQEHPLWIKSNPLTREPRPYVMVREGLHALLTRSVFYELVALAEQDYTPPQPLGLWSCGHFFPLDDA